ncbi:sortase [bacterium]|nr:sortase [bacterium]
MTSQDIDSQNNHPGSRRNARPKLLIVLAIILLTAGAYLLLLVLSPSLKSFLPIGKSSIDLNLADDANDSRDRIQIEKINLEVPFGPGGNEQLEKGAWHRYPERGNPEKGGNFIISAHRFRIGTTPGQTKNTSPFYNIGRLAVGDSMRVYYRGKWYDYVITKKYQVKPDAVYIEAPSKEAKLTLYSCTLAGSADGRDVIEAKLK